MKRKQVCVEREIDDDVDVRSALESLAKDILVKFSNKNGTKCVYKGVDQIKSA